MKIVTETQIWSINGELRSIVAIVIRIIVDTELHKK